ncbi:phytoene/squalene synthase family protein [Mesorhizobium abyssinicae]|uniref:phytoene/squalene synthase family protein n=1 Tax=Mesorhizobium TaxID=68287 RepID=UPI000FE9B5C2|nr:MULTISPECIES: phytoene/squalene synthase family protein [Mesorhizobium]MDX8434047.1 phytoene/squalene synthase family protein [Mesorhizobium abyssinicae]RWC95909.1 MAG: phytoene/squalene synthase family protein [Mesorhizobium sp.]
MDAVRASDHDRYLSALYAPADKRDALFSLYAFNAEIASVRDRIHEPLPGEVRLQWWRDVIAAENDAETGHPIADALRATIAANRLPKPAFDNMLEARIFDLYDDVMRSRTDLEGYCGETAAALIQLAAMVLDPQEAPRFAELAGRAGCAQAITGLLLLLPLHRRRGQCFVPADILAAAGSSSEEFVKADGGPGAQRAVAAMIALAREHLSAFERGAAALPASLRPAFLPLVLTRAYLGKMEGRSPLDGAARLSALRRHWLLLRRASKGWPAI